MKIDTPGVMRHMLHGMGYLTCCCYYVTDQWYLRELREVGVETIAPEHEGRPAGVAQELGRGRVSKQVPPAMDSIDAPIAEAIDDPKTEAIDVPIVEDTIYSTLPEELVGPLELAQPVPHLQPLQQQHTDHGPRHPYGLGMFHGRCQ